MGKEKPLTAIDPSAEAKAIAEIIGEQHNEMLCRIRTAGKIAAVAFLAITAALGLGNFRDGKNTPPTETIQCSGELVVTPQSGDTLTKLFEEGPTKGLGKETTQQAIAGWALNDGKTDFTISSQQIPSDSNSRIGKLPIVVGDPRTIPAICTTTKEETS